jgi:hypothetical protein
MNPTRRRVTSGTAQQRHHVGKTERAAGVATVGEQNEDLASLIRARPVHILTERVVQRGETVRLAARMRSTMRGKSCWPYLASRTLGVEIDERECLPPRAGRRNLTAAVRAVAISVLMLPLVSNSSPMCSSGAASA